MKDLLVKILIVLLIIVIVFSILALFGLVIISFGYLVTGIIQYLWNDIMPDVFPKLVKNGYIPLLSKMDVLRLEILLFVLIAIPISYLKPPHQSPKKVAKELLKIMNQEANKQNNPKPEESKAKKLINKVKEIFRK